jgi:dienelactone hydrolase
VSERRGHGGGMAGRLRKTYEPHVYPKATHSFVVFQEVAGNPATVRDGWSRTTAFLKKNLT